jgi:hypothetical protein
VLEIGTNTALGTAFKAPISTNALLIVSKLT